MSKFNNFIEDLARVKLYIDNDLEQFAAELNQSPEQLKEDYERCKLAAESLGILELKMLWYLLAYWNGKKDGVIKLLKFLKTRYENQKAIYVPEFIEAISPPIRLSENLKALRAKNKLTQQTVCTILKIKQSTLSGYELGTHEPDGQALLRLADFYGVTVDYLLRGVENEC